MKEEFKPLPDSGQLFATQSKNKSSSPDYFGEFVIDLSNKAATKTTEEGLTVFRISGWKRVGKNSGATYLSLAVNRWVDPNAAEPAQKQPIDDDVPF